jgi:hypothetical protein
VTTLAEKERGNISEIQLTRSVAGSERIERSFPECKFRRSLQLVVSLLPTTLLLSELSIQFSHK